MSADTIVTTLRDHELELRAVGIERLAIFGSVARGDSGPDSDIDLLARFDEARDLSMLDVIRAENLIADLLGQPVDLIEEGTLKPRIRRSAERDMVRAF